MNKEYSTSNILNIAKKQRNLLIAFFLYLLAVGIIAAISDPAVTAKIRLIAIPLAIAVVILVGVLAFTIYGKPAAILLTILCIVPLINLIIFFVVNGGANKIIKSKGYSVGLAGADIKAITNDI